jgi:DNA-binding NarL/FixJ family response regulator
MNQSNKIRMIVADDHALFRAGFIQTLESSNNIRVIAQVSSGNQVIESVKNTDAEIISLDLSMPEKSGIDLIKIIKEMAPKLKILVVSMHDEMSLIKLVIKNGAAGFLTKNASPEDVHLAINTISTGGKYLPHDIAEKIAFSNSTNQDNQALTLREIEILRMIAQEGLSLVEIAKRLNLSPKTVTSHKTNIMTKLSVESNLDLLRESSKLLQ